MTYSETQFAATPANPATTPRRQRLKPKLFAIGLLMPAFFLLAGLIFYPLYTVVDLSFRVGPTMDFSRISEQPYGLGNYIRLLADSQFWSSIRISALYVVGSLLVSFIIGLWTALLLNRNMPARRWLRTVVLLPWAVPGIVAAIIFTWMFDGSYGLINAALRAMNLAQSDMAWLMNSDTAIWAVILPTAWKAYPLITLTILAALQTIPEDLYEAAAIDGASRPQLFRYITWPGIISAAVMAVLISALWISMDVDIIFGSTGGGPADATNTLPLFIYNEAFQYFRMGTAAAGGVMMMISVAAISGLAITFADKQKF